MKYLSVCSGIEAASVAWHPLGFDPLGFDPVGFAEVDKFPAAVLATRYPHVQNFGDMNGFSSWDIEPIDVLVGGTPCVMVSRGDVCFGAGWWIKGHWKQRTGWVNWYNGYYDGNWFGARLGPFFYSRGPY